MIGHGAVAVVVMVKATGGVTGVATAVMEMAMVVAEAATVAMTEITVDVVDTAEKTMAMGVMVEASAEAEIVVAMTNIIGFMTLRSSIARLPHSRRCATMRLGKGVADMAATMMNMVEDMKEATERMTTGDVRQSVVAEAGEMMGWAMEEEGTRACSLLWRHFLSLAKFY